MNALSPQFSVCRAEVHNSTVEMAAKETELEDDISTICSPTSTPGRIQGSIAVARRRIEYELSKATAR